MSRDWKPGDVAMVTFGRTGGGEPFGTPDALVTPGTFVSVAMASPEGGVIWRSSGGGSGHDNRKDVIRDTRPLVVIDPEDPEQVKRLRHAVLRSMHDLDEGYYDPALESVLGLALRSLITPPKPEEPTGLGAVVETSPMGAGLDGDEIVVTRLIRHDDDLWWAEGGRGGWYWRDVPAIEILSAGWSE